MQIVVHAQLLAEESIPERQQPHGANERYEATSVPEDAAHRRSCECESEHQADRRQMPQASLVDDQSRTDADQDQIGQRPATDGGKPAQERQL